MKKMLLALAALATFAVSAMGQSSDSSSVTFTVNAYRAVAFGGGSMTFTITDGGFSGGPYDTTTQAYTVTANTTWNLTAAFATGDPQVPAGSAGTWSIAANLDTTSGGAGSTTGNAWATLTGTGNPRYLAPGNVTATMTITVGP
jgi:hypothetical protein